MKARGLYFRLAIDNIRNNKRIYIPYFLTCILNIAMFYIVTSLSQNKAIAAIRGGSNVQIFLNLGVVILALFSIIILFYTNNFLMRQRKKEFGLLNILGMDKKHIKKIIIYETMVIAGISLGIGLIFGIIFDKMMYLLIGRILTSHNTLGFYISQHNLLITMVLFLFIFSLILIKSILQISLNNPLDLLRGASFGEKEPKARWLLTLVGLITLGGGYYISLTTESPLKAFLYIFVAVILVIIGTYLLFSAGSVVLLKMLKKNKRFYYNPKHFFSVSSLIYRMKQNAIGLANICILSTMVLVMLSTTTSLWAGIDDFNNSRFPYEVQVTMRDPSPEKIQALHATIKELNDKYGISVTDSIAMKSLTFAAIQTGNTLKVQTAQTSGVGIDFDRVQEIYLTTLKDYNTNNNTNLTLKDNEVLFYSTDVKYPNNKFVFNGKTYTIKKRLQDFKGKHRVANFITPIQIIVVKDDTEFYKFDEIQKQQYKKQYSTVDYTYDYDFNSNKLNSYLAELNQKFKTDPLLVEAYYQDATSNRFDIVSMYTGLLFLGIFLSVVFIMAAVLIIYYKQVSEGYEDQERYNILQKVGMSQKLVKKSINSQVITIFMLPPLVAGIHICFAFPIIKKLMLLIGLTNTTLFIIVTAICFLIFVLAYILIYKLTARTYYRIIKR